jgi:hypothetical protein
MKPVIILVSGNGPGAGKSTFAKAIGGHLGYALVSSFAAPLKALCLREFGWDGEKDAKGRRLLQEVGVAARHYDPGHWARKALERVEAFDANYFVFDDARFPNEAQVFRDAGYVVHQYHIIRSFAAPPEGIDHESEGYIPAQPYTAIFNDGSGEELALIARAEARKIT